MSTDITTDAPKVVGWVKTSPASFHLAPAVLTVCQKAATKRSDDSQIDEAEAELSDQAQARDLIGQSKRDLSEAVSNMTRDVPALGSDKVRLLRLERELREHMGKKN